MLVGTTRSGLTESTGRTSAIAIDTTGGTLLSWGSPDRPLFYRSAIKPFQATVSIETGATLDSERLAVACSSHGGAPVQLAHVEAILASVDLDERALRTPPDWPLGLRSRRRAIARGHRRRPIFHNCSGKHAGWLAACHAAGLDTASYLDPDHPIQRDVTALIADVTEHGPEPVGVDGCGAPTLRGTLRGLARGYSTLTSDDRFSAASAAMTRFGGLVGANERVEVAIASWWDGPVKTGAEGLLVAAHRGVGVAVKSEEGDVRTAAIALVTALGRLGLLSDAAAAGLEGVTRQPVRGGGVIVGATAIIE